MSDHLLRLARVVADLIEGCPSHDVLLSQCEQVIRDLEAAPAPERPPSPVETALREFAGFISGYIPELHGVEVPRIAESVNRYLNASGPHVPPAPERRTITREEFHRGIETIRGLPGVSNKELAYAIAAAWRLTVEDA